MSRPTTAHDELDQRIYDAYQAFGPSDEQRARVLESLTTSTREQDTPPRGHGATRRPIVITLVALAAAACFAIAVLVVPPSVELGVGGTADAPAMMAEEEAVAYEDDSAVDNAAEDYDLAEKNAIVQETVAQETADQRTVTLEDGTTLVVGDALEEEPAWDELEDATSNTGETCQVTDRSYVRFDGDPTWYELLP